MAKAKVKDKKEAKIDSNRFGTTSAMVVNLSLSIVLKSP